MSFLKQGTPQPMKVASSLCEICGQNQAVCLENGKMVCNNCRDTSTNSKQEE